jgi:hypothetical protein
MLFMNPEILFVLYLFAIFVALGGISGPAAEKRYPERRPADNHI